MITECILFDLGGVLVELHEEKALMAMCPHLDDRNAVHDAWVASPAVRAFETGKIGFDEFCRCAIEDLGVSVDLETFRKAHAGFLGEPFPGAAKLIDELRQRFAVACLSNTNPAHIDALRQRSDLLDHFDHCFLSYETSLLKPEVEAFDNVSGTLEIDSSRILFFDDKWQNVEAARIAGMEAHVVSGIGDIREQLHRMGLLTNDR